jgi:hypothetical protein
MQMGNFLKDPSMWEMEGLGMSQMTYEDFAAKAPIHQGYQELLGYCISAAPSISVAPCNINGRGK